MGSLINTVGTRLLIEHFNTEFRGSRLDDLRNDPPTSIPAGPPIQQYFLTNQDLNWLTNNMTHAHANTSPGNRCFVPPKHSDAGSPHAIARWMWFIGNPAAAGGLTAARQVDICNAIYYGLNNASSLGTPFDRIEFDAVDSAPGGGQSVLAAEEWDRNGVRYYKIVLVTPPIPRTAAGGRQALDPQPGDP
jgi:hypothetical protein